jgi:hypothetical protein
MGSSPISLENTSFNTSLKNAWKMFAVYDYNATIQQKSFNKLQTWILVLGVIATALAVSHDLRGPSQPEIATILRVGLGTINRDLSFLRQEAKANIKKYIDERLPEEYEKCLVGLTIERSMDFPTSSG